MSTTKTNQPEGARDDAIAALRQMMPVRPLTYWQHLQIAERQATRLHELLRQTGPAADLKWATELKRVTVVLVPRWRSSESSGITTYRDGQWAIGVNKSEPHARRRFTLAHELKHYLDGPRDNLTYRGIEDSQRELIANYFAACYLMPKLWLRRWWTRGVQDTEALAGLFIVSPQAMETRLKHLGYIDTQPDRTVASYFRKQTGHVANVVDLETAS